MSRTDRSARASDLDAEEPERVAARVVAAAALLGDCVVPYASVDPVVSDAFL